MSLVAWYAAFVAMRLLVAAFVLSTSAYSILNYTPFVFYQFIRPRVFGWVNQFVAWHHVWYCAAYVLSVLTLLPDLMRPQPADRGARLTRRVAIAYVVVWGLIGEWLVVTPFLPTLWNDRRSLVTAIVSFVPLLWLAIIDHLATRPLWRRTKVLRYRRSSSLVAPGLRPALPRAAGSGAAGVASERRLLLACLLTAGCLWMAHLAGAWWRGGHEIGALDAMVQGLWSLSLHVTAMMAIYALLNVVLIFASIMRAPLVWEYGLMVGLAAAAIAGVLLGIVFPNLAFGEGGPWMVSSAAGVTLAMTWSALALRRPRAPDGSLLGGLDLFMSPIVPPRPGRALGPAMCGVDRRDWWCAIGAFAVPISAALLLAGVERSDWNFLLQKVVVVVEWALTFGFCLGACRTLAARGGSPASHRDRRCARMQPDFHHGLLGPGGASVGRLVAPLWAALLLVGLARTADRVPQWAGDPRLNPEVSLDRYASADVSFRLLSDVLIRHPGRDAGFLRYLQQNTSVSHAAAITAPDARFSSRLERSNGPLPDVFVFVLDSLRRDYLSPFNPAVSFTPEIARFAAEGFAFTNTFSRYGGTSLAVPSIWAGGMVIHRTSMPEFPRTNALEQLLDADGYQWFMSLDTVMAPLLAPHEDLVELDRGRRVMEFDLCHTLEDLEGQLAGRDDRRPAFGFSLPQNLHISLRQHAPVPAGEHYPGFFEPYAAEVHRLDGCFGAFIARLKRMGRYARSIVVLTSDHGDSLGEGGRWGHGVSLDPEVVRIPLIMHVPDALKPLLTTDVTRLAFSSDVVPTLYALLGHPTLDLGPLTGTPLFVSRSMAPSPRRRGGFLLASSYGPTYGMLRQNGRSLYVVDLVNGREYAFDLTPPPVGRRVQVTDETRRVNRPLIRSQIAALADRYQFHPQ